MDQMSARLFTVRTFAERNRDWLTQAALRAHVLNATDRKNSRGEIQRGNGLVACGAVLRLGRKILIDEGKFMQWLVQQQRRGTKAAA